MAQKMRLDKLYDLQGRVALVTGGGTGIGWMIAQGLAANGAKVYITGRRKEVLERSAAAFAQENQGNGLVIPLGMDATDRKSILSARDAIASREGRLHILVNNAGQTGPVSLFFNDMSAPEHKDPETLGCALFENESFESWAGVYSINTFSIFFVTTAFLGLLAAGSADVPGYTSCVVNITSVSGVIKLAQDHFAYNSAKAAASHLTKMLATELALKKVPVRVCAVAPGVYESEMTYDTITADLVDKVGKGLVPVPEGRPGTAQEVAGTVIYLASPAGCYTNGQEIIVDGGFTAVNPSTS
ncbi:Rhamnolipids biosynthesis 3-oxoacyl-[acyl-carrier-protein] reductase [Grifola frondosa]|uniref:Rhamnolipids biosynthesis 3-oxoacyl-[acyl-carrier-protein] reductase n=1 Tax=Grifola frondosa TaxID=5627 RepID=A0A1C7LVY2_GRIFR|nr:Rhamnolipids biosynthesis 3-oxoacyl-[acyl-carrier-protein] reductase [Grifola frondosa]